jgi:hypothetical protein
LCFLVAGLFFFLGESTTPRAVQILGALGVALFGVSLLILDTSAPAWIFWFLVIAAFAGLFSEDIYEVAAGQKHWVRLLPLPMLLLITIFGKRRDDNAA